MNNHRRRRERRRRSRRRASRLKLLLALVAGGGLVALGGSAFTGASALGSSCSLDSLRPVRIGQNSFVYAADGTLLGAIPAERNREPLDLAEASKWVVDATVAVEDHRFYEHEGIDAEGVFRAAWVNLSRGKIVQGGSTITQQLVRNLYVGREQSLERKVKEACLALKLERHPGWSKDRILEAYLNQVYFGNRAYGIQAAAQTYFSKDASALTLTEAALLAGLPQAPSVYDPFNKPDEAVRRRNDVLLSMLGAGYIDVERYRKAVRAPLRLDAGTVYTKIREPYFFSYVRDQLIASYGAETVRSGGLRVTTTIDPRLQRLAVKAIRKTLTEKTDPAAALVSINPKDGAIKAMTAVVPGRKNIQFNLAAQGRRQAGSAFKTFVLAEAVRSGINPHSTQYLSAPFRWQPDPLSEPWEVKTYDETYVGPTTIAQATLRSDNTVYARLTLDVGPEDVVGVARRMGIRTKLQPVASVGLGSNSVSPLEMASAYATLAAGGVYSRPMAITKVVLANGKVDAEAGWGTPKRRRVLPDGVAYEVTRILEQNVLAGTGTQANIGRPAAGKTGTTDNFADAWFAGYTPQLATVVWLGYPNAQIEMANVHGIRVAGGTFPAMIWGLFMRGVVAPLPVAEWPLPTQPAVWLPFDGEYAFDGALAPTGAAPVEAPETDASSAEATTEEDEPEPAPTTTEPPPATTTEPPPPTTTEPPATTTSGGSTTTEG